MTPLKPPRASSWYVETAILTVCFTIVLVVLISFCGCTTLQRWGWTGGGAAGGALVGVALGGPAGAAAGAAIGGVGGSTMNENTELRDGTLIGSGAIARGGGLSYAPRIDYLIPRWVWWCLAVLAVLLGWPLVKLCWRRYREHVFAGLKKLFTGKPLLAAKSLLKASGVLHSRTLKGPP